MEVEAWMLNGVIAFSGVVLGYGVMQYRVKQTEGINEKQGKLIEKLFQRDEEHIEKIVELQTQIKQVPTMKEVDNKFTSKEMFRQMEKHFDAKIDGVKEGMKQGFDMVGKNLSDISKKLDKV